MANEIHYVSYDPEAIWDEMQRAYADAGGDILYPGDEKEMLLRGVQSIVVQCFAGIDNALRMATLRYAAGEYLDIYGEGRGCERIAATAASAVAEIIFKATGQQKTVAAGTAVTADGVRMYVLDSDIALTGKQQTVRAKITCTEKGSIGNALAAGQQMQFMVPRTEVKSVYCVTAASGGQDAEEDDVYRERIRIYGLSSVTTGPKRQYEAGARAVSSEIIDAQAVQKSAGAVNVSLIIKEDGEEETLKAAVLKALSADDARPLTDTVTVTKATDIPYTLILKYKCEAGQDISAEISEAISEYQDWQENTIAQPFNPDRLMAAAYSAGAVRVTWGDGSAFNGGAVQYTELSDGTRCKGTITAEVMSE